MYPFIDKCRPACYWRVQNISLMDFLVFITFYNLYGSRNRVSFFMWKLIMKKWCFFNYTWCLWGESEEIFGIRLMENIKNSKCTFDTLGRINLFSNQIFSLLLFVAGRNKCKTEVIVTAVNKSHHFTISQLYSLLWIRSKISYQLHFSVISDTLDELPIALLLLLYWYQSKPIS